MVIPNKKNFTKLHEAQEYQEEFGGVILVNDNGAYTHCHCTLLTQPCLCRDRMWINSLAPSWSEADPVNMTRDPRNFPVQGELL